ncbi:MAG TPA: hypothetical protein VF607_07345 [Verrucomicrobiae bacterium]
MKLGVLLSHKRSGCRGFLQIDLVAALVLLTIALIPVGFAFQRERHLLQVEYQRAAIDELVDGELELLVAGGAQIIPAGEQPYLMHSRILSHLPPGHFQLTRTERHLQLAWLPDEKAGVSAVVREATLK